MIGQAMQSPVYSPKDWKSNAHDTITKPVSPPKYVSLSGRERPDVQSHFALQNTNENHLHTINGQNFQKHSEASYAVIQHPVKTASSVLQPYQDTHSFNTTQGDSFQPRDAPPSCTFLLMID